MRDRDISWTKGLVTCLLLNKLNQNRECVDALLATRGRTIVVINGHDNVLGSGQARFGLNLTGEILMVLREHFSIIRQQEYIFPLTYKQDSVSEDPIS